MLLGANNNPSSSLQSPQFQNSQPQSLPQQIQSQSQQTNAQQQSFSQPPPLSQLTGPNITIQSPESQHQISPPHQHQNLQNTKSTSSQQQQQLTTQQIPELSLLARVPPPANPADQNPPCNTLYVGNLPPDATEAELRALFSPQRGFRRLSFRNKMSNSGGVSNSHHGPMCFVEFEDVAHATRALAELYGRTLPRANGTAASNKGGIRLSFSKNPLGVRGPGQNRRNNNTGTGGVNTVNIPVATGHNGLNPVLNPNNYQQQLYGNNPNFNQPPFGFPSSQQQMPLTPNNLGNQFQK
ncbi:unnamed protein product [[Candida] boidinii]|nr:unnamed protein product [[Candida] boidinii]